MGVVEGKILYWTLCLSQNNILSTVLEGKVAEKRHKECSDTDG